MKKIIISALAIIMAFSAAGCGSTEKNGGTNSKASAVNTNETNDTTDKESTSDTDITEAVASTKEAVKIGNVRIVPAGMEMHGDIKNKSFVRAGQLIYNEVCDLAADDIDSYAKHINFSGYFGTGILEAYYRTEKEEEDKFDSILYRFNPFKYVMNDYNELCKTVEDLTEEQQAELERLFADVSDDDEFNNELAMRYINYFIGITDDSFVAEKLKTNGLPLFKDGAENFTPSDEDTIFVIPNNCEHYNDTDIMGLYVIIHTQSGDIGLQGYAWVTDDDEGAYIAYDIDKADDIGDEDEFIETYMTKQADAQVEEWKDRAPNNIYELYFSSHVCDAIKEEGGDVNYSLNNPDENVEKIVKRDFPQATSPEGITANSDSTAVGDKYIIDMLKEHSLEGTLIIGFKSDIKEFLHRNDEFVQYLDEDGIIHQSAMMGSGKFENGKDGAEFGKYIDKKSSAEE
ncbi:LptM family lipoprotein [Ruminococcus albus]|uniref:Uncharacterized protein n=1 Tax=Ruminococcus albus TaxID=1264 RepID=A0A1I1P5I2_RUMAL|nr:hypothetical protein [Ruminococcus albus]SFD04995.1 hypothetical protein SAMN02910406_02967 [Ruminococcus albus]